MNIEEIKKRTEEIKSYDYSFVERYINEKTRFDGTAINDHKKELVGSVEYLLSIIKQAEKDIINLYHISADYNVINSPSIDRAIGRVDAIKDVAKLLNINLESIQDG